MQVQTIGIDLAKNVFQVHGVDEQGEIIVIRQLRRKQVIPFLTKIEPCLIGMEACATAHHWARELTKLGHTVRLIPPVYVKAYVKRSKNDAADAAAICEAVTRPSMRFVPIKTEDQQAAMAVHRARSLLIRQRTQLTAGTSGRVGDHCRDGSRRSGSTRRDRHGCAFDRISASRDG
ncbi:MAG: transposase, partial [Alphaproteobacteria bacterium]